MAKIFDTLAKVGRAAASLMTAPQYLPNASRIQSSNFVRPRMEKPTKDLAYATQVDFGQDGRAILNAGDPGRNIREGFTSSHYVYLCVNLLASELARPDWVLERRSSGKGRERQWEVVPDTDFEELMKRPNPYQSGIDLRERAYQHLFLTGNALILKVRGGVSGKVRELWVVPPDQIKPVPSRKFFLSHYEYRAPGDGVLEIDPDDIIHLMLPDPANIFWGMSPLKAMAKLIDTEGDALNWWRWAIRNRAAKDGFIKYKRLLTPKEYERVKRRLYEQVVGPWNARLPMILTGDADWVSTSQTAVEMDWLDTRKMTREEICIGYGCDPILVGIPDKSTYNNKKEARLSLWQDNLLGTTDKLKAIFDLQLLADFVRAGELRKYRTGVDLSRVPALLQHLAELADPVSRYWEMGWTANDLNTRFGLGLRPQPPETGDQSWITGTVSLADQILNPPAPPVDPALVAMSGGEDPEEEDLQAIADGKPPRAKPSPKEPKPDPSKPAPKREGATPASKGVYRES